MARRVDRVTLRNRLYGFVPPEHGEVVLGHRRVYILPTRLGWLFGATLAILLVGSINYALALGFALTFFLAGLGLAGMVHTARNLARLGVSAARAEPVFAGQPAQLRLLLAERAAHDRPQILVRHLASGAQCTVELAAGETVEAVLAVPTVRRGWLDFGRFVLETRFPLGLFRAWSHVEPAARCLVYPRPLYAPLPPASALEASGGARAQARGTDDYAGLRAFQRSDSPRHVAWKALARADELLTKQFHGEASAELVLDWALAPASDGVEARLSRLAGWVVEAERAGLRYGLRAPGLYIAPGRGAAHRAECLRALALWREPQ
ncbi:MAG: DUF58 domain-containing protein [Burkholderiales bacterium]|nr:DUF58 domain-containing protein [Burkholderiales bacterium]